NGDMALHICCRMKNVEMAKVLVEFNANLDSQNDDGQTPLHIATLEGDQAMVKYFYYRIANPNITDKLDRNPLHIAAERGLTKLVEILTENFKSNVLERTKDGSTLLHIAARCGHPDTVLTLINKGIPLHTQNKVGAVCLHEAAKYGHVAVVWALLLKGMHVDTTTKDGLTALHIAAENCHPHVVEILQGFGAQVQLRGGKALESPLHIAARVKDGEKVVEMLLKSGAEVNTELENGETAMHVAARHGNLQVMKSLVEEGADLTWKSKAEETPLHVAVRHCHAHMVEAILNYLTTEKSREEAELCVRQRNQKDETPLHLAAEIQRNIVHRDDEDVLIIRTLMEYNANATASTKQTEETPIHYCARVGNSAVLQEMLHNVPSNSLQSAINMLDKAGRSALLLAAEQGHTTVVDLLLQNHARVDVFNKEGKSALHLAAEQGHKDIADFLLSKKAVVNAKTKLGLTPLHLSAQTGSSPLVKLLTESNTDQAHHLIHALTLSKQTPLHLAAISGRLDVCKCLLNLEAKVTDKDIHGKTPLDLAVENDHSDVVKLFLKHSPGISTLATCINIAAAKGNVVIIRELLMLHKSGLDILHNKVNCRGSGPLHLAAAGGHTEVVKLLLDAGASATEEDSEGMTALHLAAQNGHIHILEVLKSKVSLQVTGKKNLRTALHVAACFGQVDFVREILTQEPDIISKKTCGRDTLRTSAEFGYTPLHFAALWGHENVVRLLLNLPGVLDEPETNPKYFTPLHLAAWSGHTDVVRLLLSKSSSLLQDHLDTSLHLASAQGDMATVKVLLGYGADIDHTDKSNRTALHYASEAGCLELVHLLIERGALVDAECYNELTPLQYAAKENNLTTVSFLLRQPDNNNVNLLEKTDFVIDLMLCGRLNSNLSLDEMVLYSEAPLSTAVRLSRALSLASLEDMVYFKDLRAAASYCETMASDLLNLASNTPLGNDFGVVLMAVDQKSSILDLLIEAKQKNVMSNLGVQKYLTDVLYGKPKCKNLNFRKILLLFICMLICPFLWLALSLPLKHRYNDIPIVKLASHLVSHIFLLMLFICTIVHPFGSPTLESQLIPGWSECLLLIWLSGMLLSEYEQKAKRVGWAWIRMFILFFSVVALLCHILAVAFQSKPEYLINFLFARNVLLTVAMKLAFIQLLEFLMIHHLFGPLAIIIKNMMRDLCRFVIILLLFHTAFSLSFTAICQPLEPKPSFQSNYSMNTTYRNVSDSEMNALDVTVLLFFALFGLTERKDMQCSEFSPATTSGLNNLVFGIYLVVTVVVLLNLLIAMLSNTYQCIQGQSDTEWKFGRAILIRDIGCKSETPSPFNLLTFIYSIAKSAYKRVEKLCSGNRQNIKRDEEAGEGYTETHFLDTMAQTS
ncbi:transient receptor potential cation channel, subfamily N, member 1, partial [Silurus asotus]